MHPPDVIFHVVLMPEGHGADLADEGFLASVDPHVPGARFR